MKRTILATAAAALLAIAFAAQARPAADVSSRRRPTSAPHKLAQQAFERVTAAQEANGHDMQGHAQKAKELLASANAELKPAAEGADRNK